MENGRLIIRRAGLDDDNALAGLLGELGYPNSAAFVRGKLKSLYQSKNDCVFVAAYKGEIAGFASCHIMPLMHEAGNLCRVTALVVARRFRRADIGTKLMRSVECYARKHKCSRVEITSADHRGTAHHFYAYLGYQRVSRRFVKVMCRKKSAT